MPSIFSNGMHRSNLRDEFPGNSLMIAVGDAQLFPELNVYFQVFDEDMSLERVTDALIDVLQRGLSK